VHLLVRKILIDSIIIVPMNPQSSFWSCLLSVHVLKTVPDRKGCRWKLVTPHTPMDIPPPPPKHFKCFECLRKSLCFTSSEGQMERRLEGDCIVMLQDICRSALLKYLLNRMVIEGHIKFQNVSQG
jgi:hypothetical protein